MIGVELPSKAYIFGIYRIRKQLYTEIVTGDKKTTIAIAQGAGAYWNDSVLRTSGIVILFLHTKNGSMCIPFAVTFTH